MGHDTPPPPPDGVGAAAAAADLWMDGMLVLVFVLVFVKCNGKVEARCSLRGVSEAPIVFRGRMD